MELQQQSLTIYHQTTLPKVKLSKIREDYVENLHLGQRSNILMGVYNPKHNSVYLISTFFFYISF